MKNIIHLFDQFLLKENLIFNAVIIGGAALNILDITDRKTKDIDCLDPDIPEEIKEASARFAKTYINLELDENWLNNGPINLKHDLPSGWRLRTQKIFSGQAIQLEVLGRSDLLKTKLFAYCDRISPDFEDLKLLKPTKEELSECIQWVINQDINPNWKNHVELSFSKLKKAIGYD